MAAPIRSLRLDGSAAVLLFVACAVLLQTLVMGRAVLALNAALLISVAIWFGYRDVARPRRILPAFIAALLVQVLHFAEEYSAGFQRSFPSLFGYEWADVRFVAFNIAWLLVFAMCAVAVARGYRWGYLGAFFLAIGGGIGNGIGHLALASYEGGYFPGAYTAPLSLAAGLLLLERLVRSPLRHTASTQS